MVLLISVMNVSAQFLQRFDKKPYTNDVDVAFGKVNSKTLTPDEFKTFITWSLAFMVDETVFALSYEDYTDVKFTSIKNENGDPMYKTAQETRNVFLYRRDPSGWVKASDVVQSDYYNQLSLGLNPKTNSYKNAFLYSVLNNHTVEDSENAFGKVIKLESGVVMMLVPTSFGDTRINTDNVPFTYNKVVIFMPKGDGTYNTSIFEPIDKNTIEPELNQTIMSDFKVLNGKVIYSGSRKLKQTK